jgi:osmotically inducible protein OsmC
VPRITRTATTVWEGNLARGKGRISAGSRAFDGLGFSLATRIGAPEGKTSPEELLASAHAGCFAMSLASELSKLGSPPERLEVACEILMDEVEGEGHQIVGSSLDVTAAVEGVDESAFAGAVERADAGCSFSALLRRSGARLNVEARLARG